MKVLVINCGSSSLKYQLIDMDTEVPVAKGIVERIGTESAILTQKIEGREKYVIQVPMDDHKVAIGLVLGALVDEKHGVIKNMSEIGAVGHRVVHAGEYYSRSVVIDDEVKKNITDCIKLAPLHNAANLIGITACEELMPNTPMVAVFDTAFHQTMPEEAFMYALPYELYKEHSIRKYGFHGTSHKFVAEKAADILGKNIEELKIITCHLGNGASITAIKDGKSLETSMGFTPLEGIVMGTRSGSIDPAITTFLMKELNKNPDEVMDILNKKSGMYGLSGISSDFRDVYAAAQAKNQRAILTLKVYCNKIKQYIGAYTAVMGGVDCIVFTAGLGENAPFIRETSTAGLEFLGIEIDKEKNNIHGETAVISTENSKVKVLVVTTDEELVIARDTKSLVK